MCKCKTGRLRNIISVLTLLGVLGVIWSVFAIPVTFFYLSDSGNSSTSECSAAIELKESVCYEALHSRIDYLNFSASSKIFVARNVSGVVQQYLDKFMFIDVDCVEVLMPFMCAYHHGGLCGEQGIFYQPSEAECLNISTGACQEAWSQPELNLPQCDELAQNMETKQVSLIGPDSSPPSNITSSRPSCPALCAERFICDVHTNTCVPECPNWNIVPLNIVALGDIMIPTASALGLLAGVGVIIISIIRRKKMYSFPSVLAVYETITLLIHIVFQITTFLNRECLFCTSPNLLESARTSTPYCMLSGMIQAAYIPLQFNIWWVSHMFLLLWTVSHPFDVPKKSSTKKLFLRVHIIIIILGILVPIIPVLGIVILDVMEPFEYGTLGFGLVQSPPLFCTASNPTSYFYFIQVPNTFLLLLGLTGLILTLWTVHRKYGLVQTHGSKRTSPVSTAEVKLMIVVSYYMILGIIYFTGNSQTLESQEELQKYLECEQNGVDPDNPCSRSDFESPSVLGFFIIFYSLTLLIPAVNLLFVVDLRTLKGNAINLLKWKQSRTS